MYIALVSQKGGVGKSSLATSIAWELRARGSEVMLVDTDPQGTALKMQDVAEERGGDKAPITILQGRYLYKSDKLPKLAAGYDHVVIDTPPTLSEGMLDSVLMIADVVLVPVSHSGCEVWSNDETLEAINEAQKVNPELRAALVFTRKMPATAMAKRWRKTLEQSGFPVLRSEITLRVTWMEAMTAGQGVAQYSDSKRTDKTAKKAAVELRALVDELLSFAANLKEAANG